MIAQLPAKITTEKRVYQYLWNDPGVRAGNSSHHSNSFVAASLATHALTDV
jgi:hypothetical protein